MEDKHRRGTRAKLRWTIGFIMVIVAASALVVALARPLVTQAPPSGEVIGIDFVFQETSSPSGEPIMGLAPMVTVTKQAGGEAPSSKP